ncbi:MAG: transposase [Opitutaceae bacterium]|jgi:REP element-mobilizing transposase RayT|nr:transposase [Opitutaceae bacterium]
MTAYVTFPVRKTDALRLARTSRPGARYFVTLVTAARRAWLGGDVAQHALDILRSGHDAGDWSIEIATCMPDHLHILFALGERLSVGRCVARWKFQIRRAIDTSTRFQRDFWEHLLRPDEDHDRYGLYIFLNPYRARLIPGTRTWPGTWMPAPESFAFSEHLNPDGTPPPEWLGYPLSFFDKLHIGSRAGTHTAASHGVTLHTAASHTAAPHVAASHTAAPHTAASHVGASLAKPVVKPAPQLPNPAPRAAATPPRAPEIETATAGQVSTNTPPPPRNGLRKRSPYMRPSRHPQPNMAPAASNT